MSVLPLLSLAVLLIIGVHSILFGLLEPLISPNEERESYYQEKRDRGEKVRLPWSYRFASLYASSLPFLAGFACLLPWGIYLTLNANRNQEGSLSATVTFAFLLALWYNLSPNPNTEFKPVLPDYIVNEPDQHLAEKMKQRRLASLQQASRQLKYGRLTNLAYAFTGGVIGLCGGFILIK
jgi:hypothetical protein